MAGSAVNLKFPPKLRLNGNLCEKWIRFKTHFKVYLEGSGSYSDIDVTGKNAEERKLISKRNARIFLHTAGKEAVDLLSTFGLSDEELFDYDSLMSAFDNYFMSYESYLSNRYQFNSLVQKIGQTFDEFLTEAKELIRSCGYGLQENSILRDRIVLGIRDKTVTDSLLKFKYLSLEDAIRLCREAEQVSFAKKANLFSVSIKEEQQDGCADPRTIVGVKQDVLLAQNRRKRSQNLNGEYFVVVKKKHLQVGTNQECNGSNGEIPVTSGMHLSRDGYLDLKNGGLDVDEVNLKCGSFYLQFPSHTDLNQHEAARRSFEISNAAVDVLTALTTFSPDRDRKLNGEENCEEVRVDIVSDEDEDDVRGRQLSQSSGGNGRKIVGTTLETFDTDTGQHCGEGCGFLTGNNEAWGPCIGAQHYLEYTGCEELYLPGERSMMKAADMYQVFMTDQIIDFMAGEINLNAANSVNSQGKRPDVINSWEPTSREELKIYIGLRIWMGLVKMPRFTDYWSDCVIFQNGIAKRAMTKTRFQLIFRFWHLLRNSPEQGKAHSIHPILMKLEQRFMEIKTPGELLVLEEYTAPVPSDRVFSQYMPFQRKLSTKKAFKLCDPWGYTYRTDIFSGKGSIEPSNPCMATHLIMNLLGPYLDCGRTLCSDNYHTSMELIQRLLERKTHFLGTLDKSNPHFPAEVMNASVRKDQLVALESKLNGATVMKWGDDEDTLMVSTKYTTNLSSLGRRNRLGEETVKPTILLEYNKVKGAADTGDSLSSYSCVHALNVQWPHRVVDDAVFLTCLVNALLVWNKTRPEGSRRMSLLQFSREVCQQFLNMPEDLIERTTNPDTHYLGQAQEVEGNKTKRKARGRCRGCYKDLLKTMPRKEALSKVKRVSTLCITCPDKPYLCMPCFKNIHEGVLVSFND